MGACSTIRVSRAKAREMFMTAAMNATDEQLERFLDAELEGRLYNVQIVADDADNDDYLV